MMYLSEKRLAEVRLRAISWVSYKTSGDITEEDYEIMNAVDKSPEAYFQENLESVIRTIVNVLNTVMDEIVLQYILVLLNDMTEEENRKRIQYIHAFSEKSKTPIWTPFLKLLKHRDRLVSHLGAHFLAKLSCYSRVRMSKNDQIFFFNFIKTNLNSMNPLTMEYQQNEIHCLQMMLRYDVYRAAFVQTDSINVLIKILPRSDFQLQYQIIYCIWVLTYTPDIAHRISRYHIIPIVNGILTRCNKEKVSRVILYFYRNLVEQPNDPQVIMNNCVTMLQCDILQSLQSLSAQFAYDDEFREVIYFLIQILKKTSEEMCTFKRYVNELRSGYMEWTPVHKSSKFWIDNANYFNEKNYELLRALIDILHFSEDAVTLAVALNDIGQYVRVCPEGKVIIDNFGGKGFVLNLLTHDDGDVRYEALVTAALLLQY